MCAQVPCAFMNRPSRWARGLTLTAHAALMAALVGSAGRLGALVAVPLVALLPGLWRARPYTYALASLFVVFYAGGGLMEAFAHPARRTAGLIVATLAAIEFCGLILFVRLRAAEIARDASGTPASPDRSR